MTTKTPTDFNDLHHRDGLASVQAQINAALDVPVNFNVPAADPLPSAASPAPSDVSSARPSIDLVLKRFAMTEPNAKIWDSHLHKLLKPRAVSAIWGKALFDEWRDHESRRTVNEEDVIPLTAAAEKKGSGEIGAALRRYVYLNPSDTVWDTLKRDMVPIKYLKHAIANVFDMWITHPDREQRDMDKVVFDPTQQVDPDTHINMFRGLPLQPDEDLNKCQNIIGLVAHLCNGDPVIGDWLFKWLAYPLQNVGGKVESAVLMHSETHGSGKSLLFEGVIKELYGEYGSTLGQHQLEGQYTEWKSNMLFGLFEEVLGRDQKYSHIGTLKHMITGRTHRIEKKFVSGWEEANHMNAVFLSNEVQPFPVEDGDRRFLVIWPNKKLPEQAQLAIKAELANNGVEAFYQFLLSYPLGDFSRTDEPPMTKAKERLIDFGRPGWDAFYRSWRAEQLPWPVPYATCLSLDLYETYKAWCQRGGEKPVTLRKFGEFVGMRETRKSDAPYKPVMNQNGKGTFFLVGNIPDDAQQNVWLGRCVDDFRENMPAEAKSAH
jgi:putative DNA primase/helicase